MPEKFSYDQTRYFTYDELTAVLRDLAAQPQGRKAEPSMTEAELEAARERRRELGYL